MGHFTIGEVYREKRKSGRCLGEAQLADASKGSKDQRHEDMANVTMFQLFAKCAVFLFCEGKEDLLGGQENI
jgi:hypothetical protein